MKKIGFYINTVFITFLMNSHIHALETSKTDIPTVVTVTGPASTTDYRSMFEYELMQLLLNQYNDDGRQFKIAPAGTMTHSRAMAAMIKNTYTNYFRTFSYKESLIENGLIYIPIPIFRGALGFRTCLHSDKISQKVNQSHTLDELRKFTYGQGIGWHDGIILRHNGFKVTELPNYNGLFKQAALNRFDLFCRGANEILDEYKQFKDTPNLVYDRQKAIYYPFPHFWFTHKDNHKIAQRIEKNLHHAIADGSFFKVWEKYFKDSVEFAEIDKRKIYELENPMINTLPKSYERFYYQPLFEALSKARQTN